MITEIGHFALVLALAVAVVQATLPLYGAQTRRPALMALAEPAATAQFILIAVSFLALTWAFVTSDFSLRLVVLNSHTDKPMLYKVSGVWGNHEGSLLLWVLILALFGACAAWFGGNLPAGLKARVIAIQGLIGVAFTAFLLFTSNPFLRVAQAPFNGEDLNPLLQDPGLAFHPPFLYLGYVGLSMAFSFAIAALIEGRIDAAWGRWVRPWTLAAWIFLTIGIALGSWWAYYELGWGGFWFWDPVENASFMPWLIGTALIHSLAVTEKRGSFKNWTVLLAIAAFSLSLLGTFLVRSGVLTSVHAFATDPRRGIFILIFLVAVIGSSLALFAARAPKVGLGGRFSLISRESLLLTNNVLLVVACATVLLGTLYPLLIDALGAGKISVGPPYFNAVFVPVMSPILFLMGIAPFARWKDASVADIAKAVKWALAIGVIVAIALPLVYGQWYALTALGLFFAAWIVATAILNFIERVQHTRAGRSFLATAFSQPRSFFGMHLAHIGIAVFVIGVTMVSSYQDEKDVKLAPGQSVDVAGYHFTFNGVKAVEGPNYVAAQGDFDLAVEGKFVRKMNPEKRNYHSSAMPMTEASIDAGLLRDVYVSLGEPIDRDKPEGEWAVRVYYKPFVDWIWGGCVLMSLGGLIAMLDRRYRVKARAATQLPAGAQQA